MFLRQRERSSLVLARVKTAPPRLSGRSAFRRGEEVLERNVEESTTGLGEHVPAFGVAELGINVDAPAMATGEPGRDDELAADRHGSAVAHEDPRRHRREAVPGGKEPAGFVQGRGDEAAVDDARAGLVVRAEREGSLVALDPLLRGKREADALRVVSAAPAGRIVMWRDPVQRRPPRSKCAR